LPSVSQKRYIRSLFVPSSLQCLTQTAHCRMRIVNKLLTCFAGQKMKRSGLRRFEGLKVFYRAFKLFV
jgi:hypothetical protein